VPGGTAVGAPEAGGRAAIGATGMAVGACRLIGDEQPGTVYFPAR